MPTRWTYNETRDRIVLDGGKPSRTKKITGTRLAGALGLNRWTTPFQVWCEVTKATMVPFEETMYMRAGNAIEPILLQFVADEIAAKVITPQQYWGELYDERKYGFFPNTPVFDGMWDGLQLDAKGNPKAIIECKTTKRAGDWIDGPPTYYLVQGLLYAALQGVDELIFAAAFLEEGDYAHPEAFVCDETNSRLWFYTVSETTIMVDGREYDIRGVMDLARRWWNEHVVTGVSPTFDEKRDVEYLKMLRTTSPAQDNDLDGILALVDSLEEEITRVREASSIKSLEKQLDAAKKALKSKLTECLGENDEYADAGRWRLTRTTTWKVDEDAMKEDGVYERYAKPETGARLAVRPKQ